MGKKPTDVRELDLSNCNLRDFEDMFNEKTFPNLRDLNLTGNLMITLKGFGYCPKLISLNVCNNRLETLHYKPCENG